jgi:hypothetical protein
VGKSKYWDLDPEVFADFGVHATGLDIRQVFRIDSRQGKIRSDPAKERSGEFERAVDPVFGSL